MTEPYHYIYGVYDPQPGDCCIIYVPEHLPPLRCDNCGWDCVAYYRNLNGKEVRVLRVSTDRISCAYSDVGGCGQEGTFPGEGYFDVAALDDQWASVSMSWLQPIEDDDSFPPDQPE